MDGTGNAKIVLNIALSARIALDLWLPSHCVGQSPSPPYAAFAPRRQVIPRRPITRLIGNQKYVEPLAKIRYSQAAKKSVCVRVHD